WRGYLHVRRTYELFERSVARAAAVFIDGHRSTSHGFVGIFGRRFRGDRHQTRHYQAVAGEADEIFFVVRKETHLAHAQVAQNLRADAVFAEIRLIDERRVDVGLALAGADGILHARRAQILA